MAAGAATRRAVTARGSTMATPSCVGNQRRPSFVRVPADPTPPFPSRLRSPSRSVYAVEWISRTKDGRLWFPTQDGVAIIDPRSVTARRITPPAVIERVVTGDSALVPSGERMRIDVNDRDLAIEY